MVERHAFQRVVTTMSFGQGLVRALRPTDREGKLLAADQMPLFDFVSSSDPSGAEVSRDVAGETDGRPCFASLLQEPA